MRAWRRDLGLRAPYALFAALVAAMLLVPWSPSARTAELVASFIVVEAIGLGFTVRAATARWLTPAERRPWRFLTASFVLQVLYLATIGKSLSTGEFPTSFTLPLIISICARGLQVPILLAGLLAFLTEPLSPGERRKLALDVVTVIGAGVMLVWYFLIGPSLFGRHDAPVSFQLAVVVLPVCDVLLLLGVGTVLMRGTLTTARQSLRLLLAGLAGGLVSDLLVTYMSVFRPDDEVPLWQHLLGIVSLMLLCAAAIERCRQSDDRRAYPGERRSLRPYTALPYIALTAGYALLVAVAARAGAYPWLGLVGGALIMTFAVAARQLISLRENHVLVVTDSLTGLANRLLMAEQLGRAAERSRSSGRPMAVLLIDLDGFKAVNDTLGHEAGDAVLVAFAGVLTRGVRQSDTAARMGGDEFAVLLDGVNSSKDAIDVATRLVAAARGEGIGCSIGIAVHDPAEGEFSDLDGFLHQADQAMYIAKRAKTSGWALFREDAPDPAATRLPSAWS